MTALTIMGNGLRRLVRDRTALFFMVLLPVVIILIIGATVRNSGEIRLGIVATEQTTLAADLRQTPAVSVTDYADESAARTALRRNELDAVVIIPAGLDATLRSGGTATIAVLGSAAQSTQQAARSAISGVVARHAARIQAATFTTEKLGGTLDERLATATGLQGSVSAVTVRSETVDATSDYLPLGFSYSAPTMLVLFVFINSLAGGGAIIQSRQLGIYERASAAPVRARDIVLGETFCYLAIAVLQSLLIVGIGAGLFGVQWGDPLAAAALITVWALVGTGTGVLAGTLFRTPNRPAPSARPSASHSECSAAPCGHWKSCPRRCRPSGTSPHTPGPSTAGSRSSPAAAASCRSAPSSPFSAHSPWRCSALPVSDWDGG